MLNDLRVAGNALRGDALGYRYEPRYSVSEIASALTLAALSCSDRTAAGGTGKGMALSQETVPPLSMLLILSRVLNRNRGQAVENLIAVWIEVNRRTLWRISDEETESSLDAGSRIVGFCPHCFRPGWRATAVRRAGRHLARPSLPKYQGIHRPLRSDVRQQKAEMVG